MSKYIFRNEKGGFESAYDKNSLMKLCYEEISDLEAKLAEKDKELSEYVKIVDDLHKQLSDKCDFCDKTKDQDKISFAIEQLEKVKEYNDNLVCDDEDYYNYITAFIDNQINELKGEE